MISIRSVWLVIGFGKSWAFLRIFGLWGETQTQISPNLSPQSRTLDINMAVIGCYGFATSNQKGPFTATLISRSRGTYLIGHKMESDKTMVKILGYFIATFYSKRSSSLLGLRHDNKCLVPNCPMFKLPLDEYWLHWCTNTQYLNEIVTQGRSNRRPLHW